MAARLPAGGPGGRLAEFLHQFPGAGGSDPLVDGQGLAQDLACLTVVALPSRA